MIAFRVSLFYWDDCQAQRVDFNSFYFLLLDSSVKCATLLSIFPQNHSFQPILLKFCVVLFSSLAAAWAQRTIIFICSVDLNYSTFLYCFSLRFTNEASRLRKPRLCLHFLLFLLRIYHTDLNSLHATAVVMIIILSVFFCLLVVFVRVLMVVWDIWYFVYTQENHNCLLWFWARCTISDNLVCMFSLMMVLPIFVFLFLFSFWISYSTLSVVLYQLNKFFYNFCFNSISFLLFFSLSVALASLSFSL